MNRGSRAMERIKCAIAFSLRNIPSPRSLQLVLVAFKADAPSHASTADGSD
jgi:hypothetical protein